MAPSSLYLGFAAAQKSVTSCRGTADDSEGLILTKEARKNVEHVKKWNWTPVLRWAAVWGIALVALSVIISKFTVLLMSIIVSAAKDVNLGVATALMTASCYLVTIFASRCFRDFAINDTVSKRLKGRWQNIIRPLGVVAVSLFMFSCFLHLLFDCFWYRRQAAGLVEDGGGPVAAEGEALEPPADVGGAAPANEEPVAAPAPAAAQTTNVERTVYTSGWTAEDRSSSEPHGDYGSWAR